MGNPSMEPKYKRACSFWRDQEDILKSILWLEDKLLRSGKVIKRYLLKFKNYSFKDARWTQDIHLKNNIALVEDYNQACQEWKTLFLCLLRMVSIIVFVWYSCWIKTSLNDVKDLQPSSTTSKCRYELDWTKIWIFFLSL